MAESEVLSRLPIEGLTTVGGSPAYAGYVPVVGATGKLDPSLIPALPSVDNYLLGLTVLVNAVTGYDDRTGLELDDALYPFKSIQPAIAAAHQAWLNDSQTRVVSVAPGDYDGQCFLAPGVQLTLSVGTRLRHTTASGSVTGTVVIDLAAFSYGNPPIISGAGEILSSVGALPHLAVQTVGELSGHLFDAYLHCFRCGMVKLVDTSHGGFNLFTSIQVQGTLDGLQLEGCRVLDLRAPTITNGLLLSNRAGLTVSQCTTGGTLTLDATAGSVGASILAGHFVDTQILDGNAVTCTLRDCGLTTTQPAQGVVHVVQTTAGSGKSVLLFIDRCRMVADAAATGCLTFDQTALADPEAYVGANWLVVTSGCRINKDILADSMVMAEGPLVERLSSSYDVFDTQTNLVV